MRLGTILRKYRKMEELTVRDLALEIGLSAPTLSRIERGEKMDGDTLVKILGWMLSPKGKA